jgi:hypothetical protein
MSVHLNQHGRAVGLVIQAQETGVDLQAAEGRKPKGFSVRHLGTLHRHPFVDGLSSFSFQTTRRGTRHLFSECP